MAPESSDANNREFRHLREFALQVLKQTLSERYLTTPLPSGKVKCWGCSFDTGRPQLHRSSPNPKRRVGEEDKPTKNKYDRTNHNNNKHAGHKDLSRGSATLQRSSYVHVVEVTTKVGVSSTSLPLSKQPQRLLELFTKKSMVIQTSKALPQDESSWATPSRLEAKPQE